MEVRVRKQALVGDCELFIEITTCKVISASLVEIMNFGSLSAWRINEIDEEDVSLSKVKRRACAIVHVQYKCRYVRTSRIFGLKQKALYNSTYKSIRIDANFNKRVK